MSGISLKIFSKFKLGKSVIQLGSLICQLPPSTPNSINIDGYANYLCKTLFNISKLYFIDLKSFSNINFSGQIISKMVYKYKYTYININI